jgi:hypothetical protein
MLLPLWPLDLTKDLPPVHYHEHRRNFERRFRVVDIPF